MKIFAWLGAGFVVWIVVLTAALSSALSGAPAQQSGGSFAPGADIGLNPEQVANATISLQVADRELDGKPAAVAALSRLAMVVSALGESDFLVVANKQGSGYCGVFQADPGNVPCDDTEEQATRFLIGGKGFQAGGAIHLATTSPDMSPGTIATKVEASGQPGSFYDAHQPEARVIIAAWESGRGSFPASSPSNAGAQDVLRDKNIILTSGQRADVASGGLDPRLLSTMEYVAQRHSFSLGALRHDHRPGTNHEAGRAMDIAVVDKWACGGGRNDPCADVVHELVKVQGRMRSNELIYCWDPDDDPSTDTGGGTATMWAQSDHCDHIHVGWDAGPAPPAPESTPAPTPAPPPIASVPAGSVALGDNQYVMPRGIRSCPDGWKLMDVSGNRRRYSNRIVCRRPG